MAKSKAELEAEGKPHPESVAGRAGALGASIEAKKADMVIATIASEPAVAAKTRKVTVSLGAFTPAVLDVPAGTKDAMEAFARKVYLEALGIWAPSEQPTVTFEE